MDEKTNSEIDKVLDLYADDADGDGKVSFKEVIGKKIIERMMIEDDELGGVYTETTGSQGSAKTSVNLAFLIDYLSRLPQDKCFWSSTYNAPLQFVKIGLDKCHFMFYVNGDGNTSIEIRDRRRNGEVVDLKKHKILVSTFHDFNELWKKAIPGMCNAVFFGDRLVWMDFIYFLRSIYDWAHIFVDEFGEVCPSDQSDVMWRRIRKFAEDVKEIRKCNKNLHTNTQSTTDVDYRVRRKLMIRIFLPGSKADGKTRVYQKAIDNLKKDSINGNMAYLEYDNEFGQTRFRNIFKPPRGISWEARIKGDDFVGEIKTRKDDSSGHREESSNTEEISRPQN